MNAVQCLIKFDQPARHPRYDGRTYSELLDGERLATAHHRIFDLMRDGEKRSLPEIAAAGQCSEAAASARMRDFRKERFRWFYGVDGMESERADGGLWMYWLIVKQGG